MPPAPKRLLLFDIGGTPKGIACARTRGAVAVATGTFDRAAL